MHAGSTNEDESSSLFVSDFPISYGGGCRARSNYHLTSGGSKLGVRPGYDQQKELRVFLQQNCGGLGKDTKSDGDLAPFALACTEELRKAP